jgi:hypothetical protein
MPLSVAELARGERTFTSHYTTDAGVVEPVTITYRPGVYTAEYEERELIPGLTEILVSWDVATGGTGKAAREPYPTTEAALKRLPTGFLWWVANVIADDVRADPQRRVKSSDTDAPGA